MEYRNPVLPGFYPDPSVIRVGRDYYLVTSTFEYFHGVPVFHSRNLLNWKQIGHVLTRRSQLDLMGRKSSEGIFAPTIRYCNGVFYLITTDVQGIGNFYVTAVDPAGPWSDPVPVPYCNIDPSLFFDDDGKVYVTSQKGWELDSHVIQFEIDIRTGRALSEPAVIWRGDGGPWCEGPHLYKIGGVYYLISASGGTGRDHRAIIGRGPTPYGPFERRPEPILTHNRLPGHPVQNLGHAELVEDHNGSWWAFFLGTRPVGGSEGFSVLGRETFLAPVVWTEDGWPVIDNNDGTAGLAVQTGPGSVPEVPAALQAPESIRTAFAADAVLGPEWCFVRRSPGPETLSLTERGGWLRLTGNGGSMADGGAPAYVCRRQQHRCMQAETLLEFHPVHAGEEAGLAVRLSDTSHYTLTVRNTETGRSIEVTAVVRGERKAGECARLQAGRVRLAVRSDAERYAFFYAVGGGEWVSLGAWPARNLSPEEEFGFTGVTVGMYACGGADAGSGGHPAPADFQYFLYTPQEE